jgi:hypothetical protein
MGYPDASMARGDGPAGQAFDPLEMAESAADLVNPVAAARQVPWLASELVKMAAAGPASGSPRATGGSRM